MSLQSNSVSRRTGRENLLSIRTAEAYLAASVILTLASIGDAVIPKILGRSD